MKKLKTMSRLRRKDSVGKKTPLSDFDPIFAQNFVEHPPVKYGYAQDYGHYAHSLRLDGSSKFKEALARSHSDNVRVIKQFDDNFSFCAKDSRPAIKRQDTKELLRQVNQMHETIARSKSAQPSTVFSSPRYDTTTSSLATSTTNQLHDDYLSLEHQSLTPSQFQEQLMNEERLKSKAEHRWERTRRLAMLELLNRRPMRRSPYLDQSEMTRLKRLRLVMRLGDDRGSLNSKRFYRRMRSHVRIEMAAKYDEDGVPDRDPNYVAR